MEETSNLKLPGGIAKPVLLAGLTAGTLDITAACIQAYLVSGMAPFTLLQLVAGGVWGKAAYEGGWQTAIAGLVFHFFIATCWAALYFLIYPRIGFLRKNAVVSGLGYGIFVWLCMNLVVVPLSALGRWPNPMSIHMYIGLGIIMLFIGLPISLMANRYYSTNT